MQGANQDNPTTIAISSIFKFPFFMGHTLKVITRRPPQPDLVCLNQIANDLHLRDSDKKFRGDDPLYDESYVIDDAYWLPLFFVPGFLMRIDARVYRVEPDNAHYWLITRYQYYCLRYIMDCLQNGSEPPQDWLDEFRLWDRCFENIKWKEFVTVPRVHPAPKNGHVYVLKCGNHYKIGKSTCVSRRIDEIACKLPEKSEVIHVISDGDYHGVERMLHQKFAHKRTNGEWFLLGKEDLALIRELH